jgi:lipoprotein-releasing system permease protein
MVADIGRHMRAGTLADLEPGEFGIVLGSELARALGVRLSDSVVLITPQGTVTPAGTLPRVRSFRVAGVFEIGMFEFDSGLALVNIEDAQRLYRMEGVSGVRLKLDDLFAAPRVARELARALPVSAEVRDWTLSHANFFRAVAIEKRVMFIILTLIVAVAAFNIVAALVMVVNEKRSDIAILRTLGLAPGGVVGAFFTQGVLIGATGTLLGVLLGLTLAFNVGTIVPALESLFGFHVMDPSVYYITEIPSDPQLPQIVLIAAIAFLLTVLATIYPALRGAATHPAEALRYE